MGIKKTNMRNLNSSRISLIRLGLFGFVLSSLLTPLPSEADMQAGDEAYANNNYVLAFEEWLKEAEAGNPLAQNNIGYNILITASSNGDSYTVKKLLKCENIDVMYRKARGAPIDWTEAVKWYRRAAEQGLPEAMTNLGYMYDEGKGVAQDLIESYKWFLLAARRDREGAEGHLELLRKEFLTPEAVTEAVKRAD